MIGGLSFSHFLNDTMQSLIPSVYPILKANYALDFTQIGLITMAFQFTTSLLQPVVGIVTDRKAQPYSLAIGMFFTFAGLIMLSLANQFAFILLAAATVGFGSAVFHPESARIARLASGGRYGFAQAVFQVGGNIGTAVGPLLAAAIIVPFGQPSIAWFSLIAFVAILVLWNVGRWYKPRIVSRKQAIASMPANLPTSRKIIVGLVVLALLTFTKALYTVSLSSYYTFYLMQKFGVSTQAAQIYLFVFLAANAAGVFFGGPIGDRIGRKYVIWLSILGALPFALAMPHARPDRRHDRGCGRGLHHLVGDGGDHRLRAGADAAPGRHDLGHLLRLRVRRRRPWRRSARQARRHPRHRVRVHRLLVPAGDGIDRLPVAEHAEAREGLSRRSGKSQHSR